MRSPARTYRARCDDLRRRDDIGDVIADASIKVGNGLTSSRRGGQNVRAWIEFTHRGMQFYNAHLAYMPPTRTGWRRRWRPVLLYRQPDRLGARFLPGARQLILRAPILSSPRTSGESLANRCVRQQLRRQPSRVSVKAPPRFGDRRSGCSRTSRPHRLRGFWIAPRICGLKLENTQLSQL